MEARDLMTGDWVCTESNPTPRQVDWIKSGEVGLLWNKVVTLPYLKPIPLTPDILEKNGFERKDDGIRLVYREDGFVIRVYFLTLVLEGEVFKDIHMSMDFAEKDMRMPIEYVHELQHALRLFGVEKEIEL